MTHKWTIENINDFCEINAKGYRVLDLKWIQKSYQNQLWALMKCSNEDHNPYWVCWNSFYSKKRRCKRCHYEKNNLIKWDCTSVIDFLIKII